MKFTENLRCVSGIYCAIHRDSGKCYVGSSVNLWKRRYEHLYKSRRGSMNRFHIALRELGADSFDLEVLERCSRENLLSRERFYITLLGAADLNGLNCRENPTATYDFKASPITRARISAAKKGLPRLPEHRAAQSAGQMGLKKSQQAKDRISAGLKGKPKSEEHRRNLSVSKMGTRRSEEAKAKTSASLKGHIFSPESVAKQQSTRRAKSAAIGSEYCDLRKPIIATDSGGKLLHLFASLLDAVDGLETPNSSLRYYLRTGKLTPKGMLLYYATIHR